jgi:arylsulfatase A-like enzyme
MLHAPENQPTSTERDPAWQCPPFEAADAPDDEYVDAETLRKAVADLGALAAQAEPFLLAVGFYRPHLPFVAPKKYWDLHDPAGIQLPPNHAPPTGAPKEALHPWLELRTFRGIPAEGPVTDETALALIRGYRASVSFVDAQVGRLLDELARLGLDDDTIVVLVGDHGWSLGEHGMWSKGSCFEAVMRAPLIVRAPGMQGGRAAGLVEFIDVYPTLCELSGLPIPAHVQGTSLVPLMREPARAGKAAAIGRTRSAETIRTERYRFTEFVNPRGRIVSRMLYDLEKDPGESSNLAEQPEHAGTVAEMQRLLGEGKGKDP